MSKYIKQHIVPKTYLKHFSLNEDGKSIYVLDLQDQHRQGFQVKNSGDNIFWKKNFYSSPQFDPTHSLEISFGEIESGYNSIISEIKNEKDLTDWESKKKLILWILNAIERSPRQRFSIQRLLEFRNFMNQLTNLDSSQNLTPDRIEQLSKQLHLDSFVNTPSLNKKITNFMQFVLNRQWEILKCPKGRQFITSDSPGFLLKHNKNENTITPTYDWETFDGDGLFFPLSRNYALWVFYYSSGTSIHLNPLTTPIKFTLASTKEIDLFNRFTMLSAHKLIIAASPL